MGQHASADHRAAPEALEGAALREWLGQAIHALEHVLPSQAPIRDFVHHNTLHGYQHLPFAEALRAAREVTGIRGFLPEAQFRECLAAGRIGRADLEAVLRETLGAAADRVVTEAGTRRISLVEASMARFTAALAPESASRVAWELGDGGSLRSMQRDVPEAVRREFLERSRNQGAANEGAAVHALWAACRELSGPEAATGSAGHEVDGAACLPEAPGPDLAETARALWERLFARLGGDWTLRSLMLALAGEDLLETVRPILVRHLASHLDQGLAAWHNPGRGAGLYSAWLESARSNLTWALELLPESRRELGELPPDAADALVALLGGLGLPRQRWPGYLERLALELPGWSGMFMWRSLRPGYDGWTDARIDMTDYLAVRLALETLVAHDIMRRHWGDVSGVAALGERLLAVPGELVARYHRHAHDLPEHLLGAVDRQITRAIGEGALPDPAEWERLARGALRHCAEPHAELRAWRLFGLCQHLAVAASDLRAAGRDGAQALLASLERFDDDEAGFIWLQAYERNYREQIFAALAANHGRCAPPAAPPQAQLAFCMDDREEGFRRHLEEINPAIETFGVAAHFGVFQNYVGLDDAKPTPLCPVVPVVVRPAHEVREEPRPESRVLGMLHRARRAARMSWKERLHQLTRRGLIAAPLVAGAAAPAALAVLVAKTAWPLRTGRAWYRLRDTFDRSVPTRLALTAPADAAPASPECPRLGFTDLEQADRIQPFLRSMGLTANFAPLVVIVGHGSNSQNNPHLAAYDCGACAGRHSGPNARLFAAMANRREVREIMAARGLGIPDGTWFIGAEHNTCDETITWYDIEDLPPMLRPAQAKLAADLERAMRAHARERCRRFASAPAVPSEAGALRHVAARRQDFSQARPELGHATNACAFVGRRSMSRGAFFDRRAFMVSYDPTQDADGAILERLLLANGPVGAGINLEYYFSTVDNDRFGCGSKVTHNIAGYFGVLEGASSDLRTGLPRQMIEIHEAMRLLVVVEQTIDLVSAIYARQPPLQELIGNGWIVVAAKDPESAAIHLFDPKRGWVPWQGGPELRVVSRSSDWFLGRREPLPPVLLTAGLETPR